MSGFFVLGVPKQKLDEIVTRRVAAMERRLLTPPRPGSTERRIKKVLDAIQENPPREVLSHEFSVPQFCNDFISLAAKQDLQFLAVARKVGGGKGKAWELISEQ